MATSKLTGNKTPEASDRTQGLISGAPGEEWYWILTYVADGSYVTSFVVMDVQITYDVEFFDRNEIDRSSIAGQQIQHLYDQIYQVRVKELQETKKPHNEQLPWNKAKTPGDLLNHIPQGLESHPPSESKMEGKGTGYIMVEPDIEDVPEAYRIKPRGPTLDARSAKTQTAQPHQAAVPQTPGRTRGPI
jgi:hypothetical protein